MRWLLFLVLSLVPLSAFAQVSQLRITSVRMTSNGQDLFVLDTTRTDCTNPSNPEEVVPPEEFDPDLLTITVKNDSLHAARFRGARVAIRRGLDGRRYRRRLLPTGLLEIAPGEEKDITFILTTVVGDSKMFVGGRRPFTLGDNLVADIRVALRGRLGGRKFRLRGATVAQFVEDDRCDSSSP